MKKYLNVFLKAVLAGAYIAIAGAVYLIVSNSFVGVVGSIVGGVLFSLGLLTICARGYYLYTGKVGYLLPYEKEYNIQVILTTILGNIVGILFIGLIINFSKLNGLELYARHAVLSKFSKPWYVSLGLSFLCGMLMYTAVDGYSKIKDGFAKVLLVFLSVVVFLVLGFDHSIANIAYLLFAKEFSFKILGLLIVMIIGNGLGAVFLNLIHSNIKKIEEEVNE